MTERRPARNQNFRDRHLFREGALELTRAGQNPTLSPGVSTRSEAMVMRAEELESLLRAAFPDADIEIQDLAGDGDHYKAVIRSAAFAGKSRVAQHQMVYAALKGGMDRQLHALALDTAPKQA